MSESRSRVYSSGRASSIQCRKCEDVKPVWYFGISETTGERRKVCKACRSRIKHKVKVKTNTEIRFVGVFDGLDWDPTLDINSNSTVQALIVRRAAAVRALLLRESKEKKPRGANSERTIADEIRVGKRVWRMIRQLAWAPIPLILPDSD